MLWKVRVRKELADILLCPRCYRKVDLSVKAERYGGAWEGELACRGCGTAFPVLDGVAFLSVIDATWKPMVSEFLARVEITEALMEDGGFEKDRERQAATEHEVTRDIMDRLFARAVDGLEITEGTRVLDLGADLCQASRYFAGLGADVVAADVEYTHLQAVDFGQDHGEAPEGYFSRVMADAHRLPFEDAAFDICFCRSTIHHLDRMHGALKEMARVTAPGGMVVLASEPVRSVLDSESVELQALFDHEQGLNERKKPVFFMTVPLLPYTADMALEYFAPTCQQRTRRFFRLLGTEFEQRYREAERLDFARSFKLALATAAVNVTGRRNTRKARKPRALRDSDVVCDVRDIIASEIALAAPPLQPGGEDPEIYGLKLYKQRLGEVYRGMLAVCGIPRSLDMRRAGRPLLRKGFREVEAVEGGPPFRWTHRRANCYIRNVPASRTVFMRARGFPAGGGAAAGSFYVNGVLAGGFEVTGTGRSVVSVTKPAGCVNEQVLEVEIRNSTTYVPDEHLHNGDTRELGVGVESIWQA